MNTNSEKLHLGYNLKRIREIQGIKQEAFGLLCKNRYSQQRISDFENTASIDESLLAELSEALGVSPDFVRSYKDENVIYNIQHHHTFNDNATNSSQHNQPTINGTSSEQLALFLEKFMEEDRKKTQSIMELSRAVIDLVQQIKKSDN